MAADEDFLGRWSRRKAAARRPADEPDPAEATAATPAVPSPPPEAEPDAVPELPDPDTLGANSDFRAFMARGVPTDLRGRALRRLWRVNPIINSLDGLDDYYVTQDFTDAATVVPDLRTVYRVGKGMIDALARPDEPQVAEREPPRLEMAEDVPRLASGDGQDAPAAAATPVGEAT